MQLSSKYFNLAETIPFARKGRFALPDHTYYLITFVPENENHYAIIQVPGVLGR